MTTPAPIRVDIWSDIACPWCYIGKRKFEAGVAAYGGPVEVEYHSFELAPDTPVDFVGSDVDYLVERKGVTREQAQAMIDRVTAIAADVGLAYDYDALKHTNTLRAHQIIQLAKRHGRQVDAVERLSAAYFIEGRHVGDIDELVALAVEIGLDADEARRVLETDELLPAVRDDQAAAAQLGISGVPFFVLDGKYGVSGAQDAATFADVLRQVDEQRDAA